MPRLGFRTAGPAAALACALWVLAGCGGDPGPLWPATMAFTALEAQPKGLASGPAPATLWVSGFDRDWVLEVDTDTRKVRRTLRVRSGPSDLVPDPARRSLYCLHLKENALSLIGGDPPAVERNLATGDISLASAVLRPNANELWVCDGLSKLHILVPKSMALEASWPVGRYPQKLAFSPDGRTAWVTLKGENTLVALDGDSHRELARVPTGIYPRDVLWARGTVCVSNYGSDDISLIDAATYRERTRVKVRNQPNALALQGNILWVACQDSYRLLAVDVASARVLGSIKIGFYPGELLALPGGVLAVADPRGKRVAFVTPSVPPPPAR